jgi:hypothetical protein
MITGQSGLLHDPGGCAMIQRLIRNWWVLGLCVALEAIIAIIYFNYAGQNVNRNEIMPVGELTLAAGVCTIAAGILRSAEGKRWLLVLNAAPSG